jgi:hypothetical protein
LDVHYTSPNDPSTVGMNSSSAVRKAYRRLGRWKSNGIHSWLPWQGFESCCFLCLFIFCIQWFSFLVHVNGPDGGHFGNLTVKISKDLWEPIVDR